MAILTMDMKHTISLCWLHLYDRMQVDRGCHHISAKAMDNLCKQMGMQARARLIDRLRWIDRWIDRSIDRSIDK